jgi:hypothetical protein
MAGAGPDGGNSQAVDRVDLRCTVPGDARLTCIVFGQLGGSNHSDRDRMEGPASSFVVPTADPQDPMSAVPLPAGLPLPSTAFGGLALAHRRR